MKNVMIVTGASSGLGECFAKCIANDLAEKNWRKKNSNIELTELWIVARRIERLENLKRQIESENKFLNDDIKIRPMQMDLTGKFGAQEFKAKLDDEFKKENFSITLLVNNAGFGTYGEFASTSRERQMEMIDLNCTSLTGITGYALPYMNEGSRIINTSSLAAFAPLGNFSVYAATKSYVLSFTTSLAQELKHKKIKVTALCPGSVSTEFANVASRGARKEVLHGKDPFKTVRHALKKSRKGKLISMFALKWNANRILCKIFPSSFIAWATYKFNKRPSN